MDEVEAIQQYLHSHAGPDRDVIMGLGYDNSLGKQIGITLIATGFEHKNPFDEPAEHVAPVEKKDEKIVLDLDTAEPVKKDPSSVIHIREVSDPMAPTLVGDREPMNGTMERPRMTDKNPKSPEQGILPFNATSLSSPPESDHPAEGHGLSRGHSKPSTEMSNGKGTEEFRTLPVTNAFLSKPSNIYAEENDAPQSFDPNPLQESHADAKKEDDPNSDMQLVIKENSAADGPVATPTHFLLASVEEPALQDETDEQKRKAAERLHKLRNLSYNINAADPNNEYEHVPAFIRRNFQEKQPSQSAPEQFYSNYTVKTDDGNQVYLSSLNTFLEGKKPD
jgi:cell division protein FtsZ